MRHRGQAGEKHRNPERLEGDTEGEAQPGWKIRADPTKGPAGSAGQCQGVWVKGLKVTGKTQRGGRT